jgi:acyl-CoA synthetase (AMP-forming)/AMP-acid ligase II
VPVATVVTGPAPTPLQCGGHVLGERVLAVLVSEPLAHARERIAGYKLPNSVEFRDEPLPLSGALKVLKRELRAPYWEGRERAVH